MIRASQTQDINSFTLLQTVLCPCRHKPTKDKPSKENVFFKFFNSKNFKKIQKIINNLNEEYWNNMAMVDWQD